MAEPKRKHRKVASPHDAPPDVGDNFLQSTAAEIVEAFGRAKQSSRASLESHQEIGLKLMECRDVLGSPRKFNVWADAQAFPFSKAWRNRLIQLATYWDEIVAAVDAIPEARRRWSVDEVIRIWNAARKQGGGATRGFGKGTKAESESESESESRNSAYSMRKRIKQLEDDLVDAYMKISSLIGENIVLQEHNRVSASFRAERQKSISTQQIDPKIKDRAQKIHELFKRPGTAQEGHTAFIKLKTMAHSYNLGVYEFALACDLQA